jgi:hypothetical protein
MTTRALTIARNATLLFVAAGLVAAAPAGARPHAPKRYVGTVTGSYQVGHTVDTWKVSNVSYKLWKFRFARDHWGGNYKLSGGTVSYESVETGVCSYKSTGSFALGKLPWLDASIDFLQSVGSSYTYTVKASKSHQVSVTETCTDSDVPYTNSRRINPGGGLWIQGSFSQKFRLGRTIKGHYKTQKDFRGGVGSWTWNLKPKG